MPFLFMKAARLSMLTEPHSIQLVTWVLSGGGVGGVLGQASIEGEIPSLGLFFQCLS